MSILKIRCGANFLKIKLISDSCFFLNLFSPPNGSTNCIYCSPLFRNYKFSIYDKLEGSGRGLLPRYLLCSIVCESPSRAFPSLSSSLSQLLVNRPVSFLKSNTLLPLPPPAHFPFCSKCLVYLMLPHCLWNFHAYVDWIPHVHALKTLIFSCGKKSGLKRSAKGGSRDTKPTEISHQLTTVLVRVLQRMRKRQRELF